MSIAELEPARVLNRRQKLRRGLHRSVFRARVTFRTFMNTPRDIRITGFQFICLMAGLYFVSYWSIPVAGVIGAALVIIALERQ